MLATIGDMPRRKKSEEGQDGPKSEPIRVEPDLAKMATMIAIRRNVSVSDLVSPLLRPLIEAEYRKEVKAMYGELPGAK
jgi:hypothetical protein